MHEELYLLLITKWRIKYTSLWGHVDVKTPSFPYQPDPKSTTDDPCVTSDCLRLDMCERAQRYKDVYTHIHSLPQRSFYENGGNEVLHRTGGQPGQWPGSPPRRVDNRSSNYDPQENRESNARAQGGRHTPRAFPASPHKHGAL